MRKTVFIGAWAFCFFYSQVFTAGAQSNNITVKQFHLDSTTSKGKPTGEKVTQEIDKDGGKVFSKDGKMELQFPEGALSKKKKISIQSVTNQVANGRGDAYEMEPSGLQFQKPVTLIYHYSEEELTGTSQEFKGMAWQDDKGKWQSIREFTIDTTAKAITTQINHFSTYSSFDAIELRPIQARVKVEKTVHMEIHFVIAEEEIALPPTIPNPQWAVNGIPFGNTDVGRISPSTTNNALFTAPVSVPDQNPVAVSAKLSGMEFRFHGRTFRDPSLVSNLLIYDKAYRISLDFWGDNSEDGICTMRWEDRGAYTLVMEGTRTMIKEISNQNLQIRLNPCPCGITWSNRPTAGPINIAGARKIDVIPASLPANPFRKVRIMLNHALAPMPQFRFACNSRMPNPPIGAVMLPPMIEFVANNEPEQKITLSTLTAGSMENNRRYGLIIIIRLVEDEVH